MNCRSGEQRMLNILNNSWPVLALCCASWWYWNKANTWGYINRDSACETQLCFALFRAHKASAEGGWIGRIQSSETTDLDLENMDHKKKIEERHNKYVRVVLQKGRKWTWSGWRIGWKQKVLGLARKPECPLRPNVRTKSMNCYSTYK